MANVFDVANYIIARHGPMSAMKLQKLAYYCQAWSLAWTDREIFPEEIRAWANGPVVRELYDAHRGDYLVLGEFAQGRKEALTEDERDTVHRILEFYGHKDPQWLSNLTHLEGPWRAARAGVDDGERSNRIIPKESLLEYYSNL